MKRVLIMRGTTGSGKTTEAKRWASVVPGSVVVAADDYMFAGGQEFDHRRLEFCHEQCKTDFEEALKQAAPLVIVDNTNTKFSDLVPYVVLAEQYGYEFTVLQVNVDPQVAFERGSHKVPIETVTLLATRLWSERLPSTWDVWQKGKPWRPPQKVAEPKESEGKSQTEGYLDVILNRSS
jgi:predicted kinase